VTEVDWSALVHAYGPATDVPRMIAAMRSPDVVERHGAFRDYYSAVFHQGSIYPSTTASLPVLFALATDVEVPGRVDVVELLVTIADTAFGGRPHAEAVAVFRFRAQTFVALAADRDPRVRTAAVPALALVFDDARRALEVLRDRLPGAAGIGERLAVVAAIGTLGSHHPECEPDAVALLGSIDGDPVTRLACLVHRARCPSYGVRDDLASGAVEALRLIAEAPPPDLSWTTPPRWEPVEVRSDLPAAYKDLREAVIVYAPTTKVLFTLHHLLGDRVADRTAVVLEQLRSPDPGTRLDAVPMAGSLVSRRSDHTSLIERIGELLVTDRPEIAAEAARALAGIRFAEPARESLAAFVAARAPQTWAQNRSGYQHAVLALARLGDTRAVPGLLYAVDHNINDWTATAAAGDLPTAADDLVPRLTRKLAEIEVELEAGAVAGTNAQINFDAWVNRIMGALTALRASTTRPVITAFLAAAVRHRQWPAARSALNTLTTLGPQAESLEAIRALGAVDELRADVVTALAAIGAEPP
jgi:HEAT repeat protein